MLIIPQDPSDNDTEDGGKTITQAFSFRRVGMELGVEGGGGGSTASGSLLAGPNILANKPN